jgi:hypothetical protein
MRQFLSFGLVVGLRLLSWGSGLLALLFVVWDGRRRARGIRRFPATLLLYSGLAFLVIGPGVVLGELVLMGGQFPLPIWWILVASATTWPGLILTAYGGLAAARERRRAQS